MNATQSQIESDEDYFGTCPKCGKNDGYLNISRNHWMVCDRHKLCWNIGSNLFSCWRNETESDWQNNADKLAGYTEVKLHQAHSQRKGKKMKKKQKKVVVHSELMLTEDELTKCIKVSVGSIQKAYRLNEAVLSATKNRMREFDNDEVLQTLLLAIREALGTASHSLGGVAAKNDDLPF